MAEKEEKFWSLIVSLRPDKFKTRALRTFLTPSSYPLKTLSINSRPKVRCSEDSLSSFGFSSLLPPHRLKPPLPPPAVKIQRSEKRLKASRPDAEIVISVGGSVGRLRAIDGGEGSLVILSKTSMTACRNVAAAVEDTTDTLESCSLKHKRRACLSGLFSLVPPLPLPTHVTKDFAVDIRIVGED